MLNQPLKTRRRFSVGIVSKIRSGFSFPSTPGWTSSVRRPATNQGRGEAIALSEEEEEDFVLVMLIKLFIISIRIRPESS